MARLLYVVASRELAENVSEIFGEIGYQVSVAHDGRSALRRAAEFDLVLADLALPDVDGASLIRGIKRVAPGLPVVVYTAYAPDAVLAAAEAAGASQILSMPVSIHELVGAVDRWARTAAADSAAG